MNYRPDKQYVLSCDNCGATQVLEIAADAVVERNFHEALRTQSVPRGMGTQTHDFKCGGCGATTMTDASVATVECSFCGTPLVKPDAYSQNLIRPVGLAPFKVDKTQAQQTFSNWLGQGWFLPSNLKKVAELSKLEGVYVPYWTFDAKTHSSWTADAGYYYYVEVEYTDSQGQRQKRQEQRTRWQPASGQYHEFFDDVLVPASAGVKAENAKKIEPFDLKEVVNFDPRYLLGWRSEAYAVDPETGFERAEAVMDRAIYSACAKMVPGDTHRNLKVNTRKYDITFKHILLPIWMAAYKYGDKTYQVLINGQTGKIAGEKPISWLKIALTLLALAALLALMYLFLFKKAAAG
ncbi:MAG: zinc ribbon domain-containing protein [Bacteroidia bacterium]|nr:zinc ribbon domain-containing protein [Bacteroidia bacterium]